MALIITTQAFKQIKQIPKHDRTRILAALEQVAADINFRHNFVTELVGENGAWRLRKGDWRAVYTIEDGDVVVRQVGNRKDIYR